MAEPFDDRAKLFYRRFLEQYGAQVESEYSVFFRSRSIDLVAHCTGDNLAQLQTTIFGHFRTLNALELKGVHDPLTLVDYNRIMMRAWGLGAMRKREDGGFPATPLPNERTVTMICVTRPTKVLDELADVLGFVATAEAGVYHCNQALPQWIIHPTELAVTPKNYPLLPLARGAKLETFIDHCLQEGLTDYLQLVVDIGLATDPEVIWRKLLEAQQMKMVISEETWPYIDQFFREMPEALQKLPTFRDALDESKAAGEAAGEARGKAAGEAAGEARGERNGMRQGLLAAIELGLELKFGTTGLALLPAMRQVENLDVLRALYEGVKTAQQLTELRELYQMLVPDPAA